MEWLEQLPEEFLAERVELSADASLSRFELLLATKEHELQHRAQRTVLERLIGWCRASPASHDVFDVVQVRERGERANPRKTVIA